MQAEKNTVVSINYEMYDVEGQLLDQTENEPMVYLHGGYDSIFPLVEEALHGKSVGDKIDVLLETDDAFGAYEAELVRTEDKDAFPPEVEVGMMFEADDPETGEVLIFRVIGIEEGKVLVDANHPLAGQSIRFVATINAIRPATDEELAHGHVHGPEGHHHH
jgi:FKBP-type peptidyl-prolyl cis-trans isomerase SlyD